MKFLFGLSFAAGFLAGLSNYGVRGSAELTPQSGNGQSSTQPFNPGQASPSGGSGVSPGLGSWINNPPASPFAEPLDIAGGVNQQISDGTWTQEMAWTSYDMDVSNSGWISWTQYVQNLAGQGIDFSGFAAPPGGSTPPATTPAVTDQWMIDMGLVP